MKINRNTINRILQLFRTRIYCVSQRKKHILDLKEFESDKNDELEARQRFLA